MRPLRLNAVVIGLVVGCLLATLGLVVGLLAEPRHAGLVERLYGLTMGLFGCVLAARALAWVTRPRLPGRRLGDGELEPAAAGVTGSPQGGESDLEEAIELGSRSLGAFVRLVQPRLRAVSGEVLARHGAELSDPGQAADLLGDGYWLLQVAPDRNELVAPGVPVSAVAGLLETLERLR